MSLHWNRDYYIMLNVKPSYIFVQKILSHTHTPNIHILNQHGGTFHILYHIF